MLDQKIEAVFENGVFRPLQPVQLPEHQRVTVLLPTEEETFLDDFGYEPLAFHECTTIRARFKRVRDFGPLPYPVFESKMKYLVSLTCPGPSAEV